VVARLGFPEGEGGAGALRDLRRSLLGAAEQATILAAPPAWKAGLDVWGELPDTIGVMRALKAQFDPERVLNRGRFAGNI
jgi:glycolate oxidase FAD binding subunit